MLSKKVKMVEGEGVEVVVEGEPVESMARNKTKQV